MRNISFFTGMMDASAVCRGLQMAEYLGAKFNPEEGYENDICIYVKKRPPDQFPKHSYYDLVDHPRAGTWLLSHPEMSVIATSVIQKEYLSRVLGRKDIILIPHHHCNYERITRENRPMKNVGVIGNMKSVQLDEGELGDIFVRLGLNYIHSYKYTCREDIIDFYKKLDIQIVWRPNNKHNYHNPLKLANAGSFGIPTVAYPEPNFVTEWDYDFIPANSVDVLVKKVKFLSENKQLYNEISFKAKVKAEKYHIDNVSKLYLELE